MVNVYGLSDAHTYVGPLASLVTRCTGKHAVAQVTGETGHAKSTGLPSSSANHAPTHRPYSTLLNASLMLRDKLVSTCR